ncbi:MAG TPA: UDP-glucose--hexose-1-phosphate uridylyltransferase [Pyrinomonadaceae bacterium]|jgi:UDPglucose--hexose-1-phosphate uridylyltransferase
MMFDLNEHPHRRFNPLTREWVLVSPHRTKRPWQGQTEEVAREEQPRYDPACYLCPGNARAGGHTNPPYAGTFVFDNDFAALLPDAPAGGSGEAGLLVAEGERGVCRVVCFSPRHDLTLSRMETQDVRAVVDVWAAQYAELGALDYVGHVQIFENRGAMMGASNPHPHGQIWATQTVPNEPVKELTAQGEYFKAKGASLLGDYLALELERAERVVYQNRHFVAVVPFWAVWPFETLVVSRRHVQSLEQLEPDERDGLADLLRQLTTRYDNLFRVPFPYSMGFHQRPTDGQRHEGSHLHAHFYPPLLRSATVRKFMVGFELLGMPQRDLTPEQAAQRLRDLPERHYLD